MSGNSRPPFSLRIPPDIRQLLQAEADAQRRSLSWLILEILRQWYAYMKRPPSPDKPKRKRGAKP